MSKDLKKGKQDKASSSAEKVVVAVKAAKEIPKTALVWALTHVVQPGDCITLVVVVAAQNSGRKLWGFPRFAGDCASAHRKSNTGSSSEQKIDISDTCSQMILQLEDVYDPNKINIKIKIISGSPCGAVAAEVKKTEANWVVLDKHLKHEVKQCMEDLQCNIVAMKRSQPKVLRLNLVGSPKKGSEGSSPSIKEDQPQRKETNSANSLATSTGSPEVLFTTTDAGTGTGTGTSSVSTSDPGTSPFTRDLSNTSLIFKEDHNLDQFDSDTETENPSSLRFQPSMIDIITSSCQSSQWLEGHSPRTNSSHVCTTKALLEKFSKLDQQAGLRSEMDFGGNIREAVSLSRSAASCPPPLCSICQHKAPVFGKPPMSFSYAQLELATGGFSQANFLAQGGFGSVHRGVLPDGQVVAVKQHKLASSQGDKEFCSEVEVLSCAQHRNVVMLIGFCIEDGRRLLVYEYICNGSLDSYLYGRHEDPLEWSARQKIGVGAARGLRYLHEECRVGCIVHRDMRPNNILITHDFEPLVGDFGLARWQPDGDKGVDTGVIGTFGYLAPEYAQSGQITEKADVYSFGVVLIEMITGRKAVDLNRPKGQQCLTEWARPLLDQYAIDQLVDPRLGNHFSEQQVYHMLHAAALCVRRDPQARPRMSQVLRILQGDTIMDSSNMSTPGHDIGSTSGRLRMDAQPKQKQFGSPLQDDVKGGFSERRQMFWERERQDLSK